MRKVNVVGAGLAGVEAAGFLLSRGIAVDLYEKRPRYPSPAHKTGLFAELVCSNSLKSDDMQSASGLLKAELRSLGSIIMEAAGKTKVPGGSALSVDRDAFARYITEKIKSFPNLRVIEENVSVPPEGLTIIATGPLTSEGLTAYFEKMLGEKSLSFFDASSPIVTKDSIDFDVAYYKSRYDKGEGNYINCPMDKERYLAFCKELINARIALLHPFDTRYFEGCLPLEVLAKRGVDTLRYGPLKPKGLEVPGKPVPYAVVQLRQDNLLGNLYNLVGFQTNLAYPEQRRVFRMIPGLENAEFVRYGLMHRNTYINSPRFLNDDLSLKKDRNILIAGQLSGVEGYVESAAMGLLAGIFAAQLIKGKKPAMPPLSTMIGALRHYVTHANPDNFTPMNANYSLIEGMTKTNHLAKAEKALEDLKKWKESVDD